jgi:hypothetical protein
MSFEEIDTTYWRLTAGKSYRPAAVNIPLTRHAWRTDLQTAPAAPVSPNRAPAPARLPDAFEEPDGDLGAAWSGLHDFPVPDQ